MSQTNILLDAGTNELEIVEFYLDEEGYSGHYGVNVAKVLEIIREQPVTTMPRMKHRALLGAFPHRDGRIVPLIDLAVYLGKERKASQDPKIIITEFNQIINGFLVSGVNRIHRLSWREVEAPGSFLQHISQNTITGVVRIDGRVVFILDMESIVSELDPQLAIKLDGQPKSNLPPDVVFTVVHAEDSGNVRNLVRLLLEKSGRFKLIQFTNGEDAWNALENIRQQDDAGGPSVDECVHAVISDIEMPHMDGLTFCRKIKEDPKLKHLPVALFSSLVTEKLEHKGLSVGADAQFAKPDLQMLSEKLLQLILQKRQSYTSAR